MKWISRLMERSQVHPPDDNYWIDNGFQYVAAPWLKRLIEATLKCKGLMALEDAIPVWTSLNSSDSCSDYYHHDGWHMLSFLNKTVAAAFFKFFLLKQKQPTALYERKYLSGFKCFFQGEHNLKSRPQIIYALWLPTIFWVCPRGLSTPSKQTESAANRASAPAV